jgi:hypothetical protein
MSKNIAVSRTEGIAVKWTTVFLLTTAALLAACSLPTPEPTRHGWRCSPVPEGFSEADLVGVWQSRYVAGAVTDTSVLDRDGFYEQIYDDTLADVHFTISGNQWYLVNRTDGGIYLHLVGAEYHYGMAKGSHRYYDACSGELVTMTDGVILAVSGAREAKHMGIEKVPRGIILWQMRVESDRPDEYFLLRP